MIDESLYHGREQTLVKHFVLDKYLERFAFKIGSWADTITYIDCFSGPWRPNADDLRDTSFSIAIQQLRTARDTYAAKGRKLRLRCFFIESSTKAYAKLREFVDTIDDIEIETRNSEFEAALPDILKFAKAAGPKSFTFTFIDPTGWSGFSMDVIAPLLELTPSEVLINFMTDYVKRFVELPDEATGAEFVKMFGSDVRPAIKGLGSEEREEALVAEYMKNLGQRGNFPFVASAIVFKPEIESTYFHLIYATRNRKGLEVFKEVETKMQPVMASARAGAKARKEEERSGQLSILGTGSLRTSPLHVRLAQRYRERARANVWKLLTSKGTVPYDDLWLAALAYPLVSEADLKGWIKDWQNDSIDILGLDKGTRVPKCGKNHRLKLRE